MCVVFGELANQGSLGKWLLKCCICVNREVKC